MLFEKKNKYSEKSSHLDIMTYVRRAARGDEKAFSVIVELYEKDVYNIAMYILGNREDAQDVTQETFLSFWRSLKFYREECSVKGYLLRIVRNRSYDILRKKKNENIAPLAFSEDGEYQEIDMPDISTDANPAEAYIRKERIELVRKAISMLGDEQRDIIIMRDINGLSYSEIAELIGLSEGTIKSRISRGRASLKKILLELGYDDGTK